ncbi:MAG: hypothetical protein IT384_11175 [Deltaproteobacteria bacterium]|nr:hypothetical protein [Deltaproteobacteria bacterium]
MAQNPNTIFRSNWYGRLPHHITLANVSAEDRAILEQADTRMPKMVLTMDEARDFLIQDSKVRTDAQAQEFRAALNRLFAGPSGASVDCLDPALAKTPSNICYVQLNNQTDADLQEAKDLRKHIGSDTDKPQLSRLNLTPEFEAGDFAQATAAFKQAMSQYFDQLIDSGRRMGGWIISGHSNGRDMLHEYEPHMYRPKVRPRDVMTELRQEKPEYAHLMDTCEKVGLLGCFHGGAKEEWGLIFPNAVIVGTEHFAPPSASQASAELYSMASRAEELYEKNWRTTAEQAVAETRKGGWKTDLGNRGVTMRVPGNVGLDEAERMLDTARGAFELRKETIVALRQDPSAFEQPDKERAYQVCNSYLQAREQLWVLNGRSDHAEAAVIRALDYVKDDLFAIRKHYDTRPAVPAGVNVELAFA